MNGPMLKQQPQLSVSITLSADTIAAVRHQIHGCEMCSRQANLPFADLLVRLTGRRDLSRDTVISEHIHCPYCISPLDAEYPGRYPSRNWARCGDERLLLKPQTRHARLRRLRFAPKVRSQKHPRRPVGAGFSRRLP